MKNVKNKLRQWFLEPLPPIPLGIALVITSFIVESFGYFLFAPFGKIASGIADLVRFSGYLFIVLGVGSGVFKTWLQLQASEQKREEVVSIIENNLTKLVPISSGTSLGEPYQNSDALKPEEKQYLLLNEYYKQGLQQSDISFRFSLGAAVTGFAIILLSILKPMFLQSPGEDVKSLETIIQISAGAIINAFSGIFFALSNRNKKAMIDFSEKLRIDRKLNESLLLIDKINDSQIKIKVQAITALNFAGISISETELFGILSNDAKRSLTQSEHQKDQQNSSVAT